MNKVQVIMCDFVIIGIFALLARIAHQSESMPLNFVGWLSTAWPFWLGMLIGALLIKHKTGQSLREGLSIWIATVLIGLSMWSIDHYRFPHWSFILVASIMSAILIFGWRFIAQVIAQVIAQRIAHKPTHAV